MGSNFVSVTTGIGVPYSLRSDSARIEFWLLKCIHNVLDFENWNPFSSAHVCMLLIQRWS